MTEEPKRYVITEFRATNFMKLSAVSIRPDRSVVRITGRNEQGKTSVLNGLWVALAGAAVAGPVPIRQGEEEAEIRVNLGAIGYPSGGEDLKVRRTFKMKDDGRVTTSVTVEGKQGRLQSPQAVLDALVGALSFDPLAFTRMKAADQFNTLRSLVPGVDFDAIKEANDKDTAERTVVNRRAKELRAQAEGIVLPPGTIPKMVDVAALEQKLGDAATHNSAVLASKAQRDAAAEKIAALTAQIAALCDERDDLQERLSAAKPLPDLIDVADVQAKLAAARAGNRIVDLNSQRARLEAEAAGNEEKSTALTKALSDREEAKRAAIAKAKMPVEGLGFGDDCITLDGLPFEQASSARQLRTAVMIATASNPRLRVIRIKDGGLLDDDAFKWLGEFCEEQDMQCWIESVDSTGTVGFVLEDGHLKGDEPEPEEVEAI